MPMISARAWIVGALMTLTAACQPPRKATQAAPVTTPWPAPVTGEPGGSAICADVGPLHVCWNVRGPDRAAAPPITVSTPPRPRVLAATPLGWRCAGQGQKRTCVDRSASAPPFDCEGPRCTQRHPRMPDDGDWSCADMAGAAICVGGDRAAGVAAAPADPGWLCGVRAIRPQGDAASGEIGRRVCVDLSPDFPDGSMAGWRCRYLHDPVPRRLCARDAGAHQLADPCDAARPCVDGSRCVTGRCVPEPPAPSCWLDAECAAGRCRFGSCAEENR